MGEQNDRGQTQLDFVLGFSILIMAVMFVFAMAPGLISPFSTGQAANPITADRIADDLSGSKAVVSPSSAELDTEFFEQPDDEIATAIGQSDLDRINISVKETQSTDLVYSAGEAYPEERGQVTVTHRIVSIDGETHWLEVRVW
ncbi:DUF7287 family protein [Natrarchaeobius chitinivorans]|nr:hypothetical protein [Natrarchaeobius chitinivorans]